MRERFLSYSGSPTSISSVFVFAKNIPRLKVVQFPHSLRLRDVVGIIGNSPDKTLMFFFYSDERIYL